MARFCFRLAVALPAAAWVTGCAREIHSHVTVVHSASATTHPRAAHPVLQGITPAPTSPRAATQEPVSRRGVSRPSVTLAPAAQPEPAAQITPASVAASSGPGGAATAATTPLSSPPAPAAAASTAVPTPSGMPQILGITLTPTSVRPGEDVAADVRTTDQVTAVTANVAGRTITVPKIGPGRFAGSTVVPAMPFFVHGAYPVTFVASDARGDKTQAAATVTVR